MIKKKKGKADAIGHSPAQEVIADPKSVNRLKTKLEIAEGVQRIRPFLQSVIDLADFVKDIDSLERSASEAQARMAERERLQAEANELLRVTEEAVTAAKGRLNEVNGEIRAAVAAIKGEPAKILAAARDEAKQIIDGASADAVLVAAQAKKDADALILSADQSLKKAEAAAADLIRKANDEMAGVAAQIETARTSLLALEEQIDEKAAEHAALQEKIDALKAQAGKILAG